MKTTTFLLILLSVFSLNQTSKAQSPHYKIIGNIEGAEGVKFILQQQSEFKIIHSDTSEVSNGQFKFTGSVENPEMFELSTLIKTRQIFAHLYWSVGENNPVFFVSAGLWSGLSLN